MISKIIDHTLLKVDANDKDIERVCAEAQELGTYSVCINPHWVPMAARCLRGSSVLICTVIGFPLGASFESVSLAETELAIMSGAHEIDIVMNVGVFKSGKYKQVKGQLSTVVGLARNLNPDVVVKVIVESALLDIEEKRLVCSIVVDSGADFIKTSTGYIHNDHLVDDVKSFRKFLPQGFKIKASGGIREYELAQRLLDLGVSRIGTSSSRKIVEQERIFHSKKDLSIL